MQQHVRTLFGLVFAAGLLAGCNSDNDHTPAVTAPVQPSTVSVKVVHAAIDAPAVNATSSAAMNIRGLGFASSSAALQLPLMVGTVVVDAVLPDGSTQTVLTPQLAGLQTGMDYVVMAVGKVADGSLSSLLVPAAATVPTAGNALVQVVHAASGAPTVDVHLTAPGAPLGSGTVTATLPFKQFTGRVSIPAGNYQIRMTPAGNATAVVFDSGPINISAGSNLFVAALDNRFAGSAPVSLLADTPRRLATAAQVRIGHASAATGNVDIYVTASRDISTATPAFRNVAFMNETGYVALLPGNYVVSVTPTGSKTAAIGPVMLQLAGNKIYTALARDGEANSGPGLILLDDFN